jgi:glycine/D-amino acid oxidase-like deaminating enzyme
MMRADPLDVQPSVDYIHSLIHREMARGVPCERITPEEALHRWPTLGTDGLTSVLYEPTAGFLRAGNGVRAAARMFEREGGVIVRGRATPAADGSALDASGAPITAGATVWAAGPWLPELFPQIVGADAEASIIPVRRDAIYFDAPNMGVGEMPTWIDEGLAVWGIPNDQGHGVKVGPEFDAGSFDPSVWPDEAHPTSIARARECAVRFPALKSAPIKETRACQHERTKSGHYVLDQHPENPAIWLAGGSLIAHVGVAGAAMHAAWQLARFDHRLRAAQQVSHGTGFQEVQLHFVVVVGPPHRRGPPMHARQTIRRKVRAIRIERDRISSGGHGWGS